VKTRILLTIPAVLGATRRADGARAAEAGWSDPAASASRLDPAAPVAQVELTLPPRDRGCCRR